MDLRFDRLAAHLEQKLAGIYVIHGDEPLFAIEGGDAIRAAARRCGFDEREVLVAEAGFKWDSFVESNATSSLFGARKVIDLRIPSGKPGNDGAKALQAAADHPGTDQLLLVTLPKVDRATQSSPWFTALGSAGVVIALYPIERTELPRWIAMRLARQKQKAKQETLQFLADRCEGNLLAARQEIEKLGLVLPEGELPHDAVLQAVTDVSRFDVFQLSEAWLGGDAARVVKIVAALEAEGESMPHLLWQLGEDIRVLSNVIEATATGAPLDMAMRNVRVWGKRQDALARAARRVSARSIAPLLRRVASLDAIAKGIGIGNAWDEFKTLALELAGTRVIAASAKAIA